MAERVQSVDRVFGLLEHLADGDGALSLSELAARSGLPMPTIHRLIRLGRPGLRPPGRLQAIHHRATDDLAGGVRQPVAGIVGDSGTRRARPEVGETSNMAMLEGSGVIYVAQVPSPRAMRMFTEVGRFVMPHCTGVGKAILSTMPDDEVGALLKRTGMPPRTEHTITSVKKMLAELAIIRQSGLRRRRRGAGTWRALRGHAGLGPSVPRGDLGVGSRVAG